MRPSRGLPLGTLVCLLTVLLSAGALAILFRESATGVLRSLVSGGVLRVVDSSTVDASAQTLDDDATFNVKEAELPPEPPAPEPPSSQKWKEHELPPEPVEPEAPSLQWDHTYYDSGNESAIGDNTAIHKAPPRRVGGRSTRRATVKRTGATTQQQQQRGPTSTDSIPPPTPHTHNWLDDSYDDNDQIVHVLESTMHLRRHNLHGRHCNARAGRGPTVPNGFSLSMPDSRKSGPSSSAECYPLGSTVEATITTFDKSGHKHCLGGDFFEMELSGARFKSRPKTIDNGDGTYTVKLVVPADAESLFAGRYRLQATLLFTRLAGVTLWGGWKRDLFYKKPVSYSLEFGACGGGGGGRVDADSKQMRRHLESTTSTSPPPPMPLRLGDSECASSFDFSAPEWAGFWLRVGDDRLPLCRAPYCVGDVEAALGKEAEGWVYRLPACYFRLYSRRAARSCLGGGWIHMIGDSNHQDTGRNIASDILGAPVVKRGGALPRTYDIRSRWESGATGALRVSNQYNGAPTMLGNNVGMRSYDDAGMQAKHWPPFRESAAISVAAAARKWAKNSGRQSENIAAPGALRAVIFNSGLHDALYMPGRKWSPSRFVRTMEAATNFFAELMDSLNTSSSSSGGGASDSGAIAIWHTTVVPAGTANRRMPLNPQKVEVQNRLTANHLIATGGFLLIDLYDMTFPWHW